MVEGFLVVLEGQGTKIEVEVEKDGAELISIDRLALINFNVLVEHLFGDAFLVLRKVSS